MKNPSTAEIIILTNIFFIQAIYELKCGGKVLFRNV
jgi:hypothetical protein